jgi:hypothetical protein
VDIEEFYDENPVRRTSEELEFGREWTDDKGNRYEVSWVHDTGELYVMGEPVEPIFSDGLGDDFVQHLPTEDVVVTVLTTITDRSVIDRTLAGWSQAMPQPNSLAWLRDRLSHPPADGAPSSGDDAPEEVPGA